MVFSCAWHFLHDRALAEEVAQDVFLDFHRNRQTVESADHIRHWLRRAAVHRSIDQVRRLRLQPKLALEDIAEPAAPPEPGDPMLSGRLRRLVASLPPRARMVVILRYQEDLDPVEIASLLEMPVRTVKSHLRRSLALLRGKLARACGEMQT